jgi:peptidyl-prolyl cis-trans isomerase SurA
MDNKKSIIYNPFFISFIIVAIGVAIFFYFQNNTEEVIEGLSDDVVAVVNGVSIYRDKFEQQLNLAGEDVTEDQLLSQMIQNQLLLQDAVSRGVSATEEEINNQYNQLANQYESEEQFQQVLEENNASIEGLRDSLKEQIIFQKYTNLLQQENDISVTEQEIETFYEENKDSLVQEGEEVPLLEDVKSQIEQYLQQEKLNSIISEKIQELYQEAEIENNL